MMTSIFSRTIITLTAGTLLFTACRKKDAPLPDNLVQFEAAEQGMPEAETSKTITLKLSRAVTEDINVLVSVSPASGIEYDIDYTTTPALVAGEIAVPVRSGSSEATITLNRPGSASYNAGDKIEFTIISSESPVIIGEQKTYTLNFSEIISGGSTMVGNGGGASYSNQVFFDLSANTQVSTNRSKWDLGFYSGPEFRVKINATAAMMAKQLNKTDLNAVTSADTVGNDIFFNQNMPSTATLPYVDYPTGELTRTAIAEISATDADNKVYIVNRGIGADKTSRGWKKVRILRNANGGYTLQHADIAATTFNSVEIPKQTTHFFNYVSLDAGIVDVAPAKTKWDISWTYYTNVTNFGGGEVPYNFQDFVIQNRNVEVAKVLTSARSFDEFSEADLADLTWMSNQNGIGSDWRAGGGPGMDPAVRTDRFYVIKDGDGNIYKLKFTAMTQNGERGHPAIAYTLVKKAG